MNYKKLTAAILCAVMTLSFAVPAKAVTKEEIDEARKKAAETEQALEVTNKKITDLEEDKKELEDVPLSRKVVEASDAVWEVESCSA